MTAALQARDPLTAIEAEFPGWHAWTSDEGHRYAVRVGATWRRDDPRPITVDAPDLAGLRQVLSEVTGQTLLMWGAA